MNAREQLLAFVNPTIQELVSILEDRERYEQEEQELKERLVSFVDNELCDCVCDICAEEDNSSQSKPLPTQRSLWASPTALGEYFGVSPQEINRMLKKLGYQTSDTNNNWFATEAGEPLSNPYTVKGYPNKKRLEWWKSVIISILETKYDLNPA